METKLSITKSNSTPGTFQFTTLLVGSDITN